MPHRSGMPTFATGMVRPKTTALFFDKLWIHPHLMEGRIGTEFSEHAVPKEVCLDSEVGKGRYWDATCRNLGELPELFGQTEQLSVPRFVQASLAHFNVEEEDPLFRAQTTSRNRAIRWVTRAHAHLGIAVTPIYLRASDYDEATWWRSTYDEDRPTLSNDHYQVGSNYDPPLDVNSSYETGIEVCLHSIPVPSERHLKWEQVISFRSDKAARQRLARLRRWFRRDLLKKSEEEVQAIISKRLDDYEWALRKHGIETLISGTSSLLSLIGAPATLQILTQSSLAAATGGIALASGAVLWIATKMLERIGLKRKEEAYIYEARQLAGS